MTEISEAAKEAAKEIAFEFECDVETNWGSHKDESCYMTAGIRVQQAIDAATGELQKDIAHAVNEAMKYQPDYPWERHTASEAVWACGSAFRGVSEANAELQKQLADKDAEVERLHERLRGIAMTVDYIWQQGPPAEMRGPLEQIETFLALKASEGGDREYRPTPDHSQSPRCSGGGVEVEE